MPGLYRSKSLKRIDENNFFIEYLDKDKKRALAGACVQLFISTPQLDKWFKSSTGNLCLVKDENEKNVYYLRLYSLMQGQLWEQKVQAPFSYSRLSVLFHYLTVNRFNYGFKFICEDEADRFFSVISKYINHSSNGDTSNYLKPISHINDILAFSNTAVNTVNATPPVPERKSRKSSSVTRTVSSISSITSINSSTIKATVNTPPKTPITPVKQILKTQPQRRASIDIKRKIEKSDISCPFRCSTNDLHLTGSPEKPRPQSANLSQRHSIAVTNSPKLNKSPSPTQNYMSKSLKSTLSHPIMVTSENSSRQDDQQKSLNTQNLNFDREFLLARELLSQYKIPLHKNSIKLFRNYIRSYGDPDRFREMLRDENERDKLNLFAATINSVLEGASNLLQQSICQKTLISPSLANAPTPPPSPKNAPKKLNLTPKYKSSATFTSMHQATTTTTTSKTTTSHVKNENAEPQIYFSNSQTSKQQRFGTYSRFQTPSPSSRPVNEHLQQLPTTPINGTGLNTGSDGHPPKSLRKTTVKLMV